jgi:hypothetical protein
MFRIVNERLAWWPVTFPGVSEDGSVIENRIELRFRILDDDEFPDFLVKLTDVAAMANPAIADAATSGEAPPAPAFWRPGCSPNCARLARRGRRKWRSLVLQRGHLPPPAPSAGRLWRGRPGLHQLPQRHA